MTAPVKTIEGFRCPRCGVYLVEVDDDDVCNIESEGSQVRHTIKRCGEVERSATWPCGKQKPTESQESRP